MCATEMPSYELTVAVIMHKIEQTQSQHRLGGAHEVPPLAEELLAIEGFREKGSQFSLGMQPLRGCP